jgi:hypothetical protein
MFALYAKTGNTLDPAAARGMRRPICDDCDDRLQAVSQRHLMGRAQAGDNRGQVARLVIGLGTSAGALPAAPPPAQFHSPNRTRAHFQRKSR